MRWKDWHLSFGRRVPKGTGLYKSDQLYKMHLPDCEEVCETYTAAMISRISFCFTLLCFSISYLFIYFPLLSRFHLLLPYLCFTFLLCLSVTFPPYFKILWTGCHVSSEFLMRQHWTHIVHVTLIVTVQTTCFFF